MPVPLHLGLEHPSALWIVAVGFLAFVAGLGVNLYRSRRSETSPDAVSDEESA
ncbi:hypothetical protein [Halobellus litoreus]|mgnify:FL=1|jgi:hypothetical protein|uniref:PEP-CTERM protein-sorting domain-containing protein n=1 Tax=Halobellus litoreus TaxID=755310 RepID=A0ABD6DSL1_9EURY|nr:hypothetical protein [Halobellus litoreus]